MKLIRLRHLPADFPVAHQTLYRWHHEGRYPLLLVKFGGALCVDLDEQETALSRKRGSRRRRDAGET